MPLKGEPAAATKAQGVKSNHDNVETKDKKKIKRLPNQPPPFTSIGTKSVVSTSNDKVCRNHCPQVCQNRQSSTSESASTSAKQTKASRLPPSLSRARRAAATPPAREKTTRQQRPRALSSGAPTTRKQREFQEEQRSLVERRCCTDLHAVWPAPCQAYFYESMMATVYQKTFVTRMALLLKSSTGLSRSSCQASPL
jgi:hypothetical protein